VSIYEWVFYFGGVLLIAWLVVIAFVAWLDYLEAKDDRRSWK